MSNIAIRPYQPNDYNSLKKVYEAFKWFDPETDSEGRLNNKSQRDPESLLVAIVEDEIVGTVSLIEDGRIALFLQVGWEKR